MYALEMTLRRLFFVEDTRKLLRRVSHCCDDDCEKWPRFCLDESSFAAIALAEMCVIYEACEPARYARMIAQFRPSRNCFRTILRLTPFDRLPLIRRNLENVPAHNAIKTCGDDDRDPPFRESITRQTGRSLLFYEPFVLPIISERRMQYLTISGLVLSNSYLREDYC